MQANIMPMLRSGAVAQWLTTTRAGFGISAFNGPPKPKVTGLVSDS